MTKVKKLQQKRKDELKDGKNLYSVAEEHMTKNRTKAEMDQLNMVNALKAHVEKSNHKIIELKRKVNDI